MKMTKELRSSMFLVCMIHVVLSISWKQEPNVVVLGESFSLKCMVTEDECPNHKYRHWMVGNVSCCGNDNCTNTGKYRMGGDNFSPYSSELTIYNLSVEDLNSNYFYLCGFKTYNQTISKKRVISYPSNRTTYDGTTIANGMLHVNFQLEAVNPVPNCSIIFEDKTFKEQVPFNTERSRFFQNVVYRDSLPLDYICKGRLQIICKVFTQKIQIIDRYMENCPPENMPLKKRIYLIPVVATIASISFISAAIVYFIHSYRRRHIYGSIPHILQV